jgi:hypothetical protein
MGVGPPFYTSAQVVERAISFKESASATIIEFPFSILVGVVVNV